MQTEVKNLLVNPESNKTKIDELEEEIFKLNQAKQLASIEKKKKAKEIFVNNLAAFELDLKQD